jgi:hypothetical protein
MDISWLELRLDATERDSPSMGADPPSIEADPQADKT